MLKSSKVPAGSSAATIFWSVVAVVFILMVSIRPVSTPPGHETVFVSYPYFIGEGGVSPKVQTEGLGWYWRSIEAVSVNVAPIKYDEPINHLSTGDNNFINYTSYVVLQWYDSAYNVKNFGQSQQKWFQNNLHTQYQTIVREVTMQYSMTKIMSDPVTISTIETQISSRFKDYIKASGLHVRLVSVSLGKPLPNKAVINEMDRTAAQQQRKKTEEQRDQSEISRKKAETSRAEADRAYQDKMGLSTSEFVQLESIRSYAAACTNKSSHCVIVQGNTPVMVTGK